MAIRPRLSHRRSHFGTERTLEPRCVNLDFCTTPGFYSRTRFDRWLYAAIRGRHAEKGTDHPPWLGGGPRTQGLSLAGNGSNVPDE
jgi:hypothetical protein